MKKALIASTALVMTAGIAAAEVTISGYGRTGVLYQEDGVRGDNTNNSVVQSRLRMNIDASTSSDAGVDFGGRIRMQWDQGDEDTTLAPGYLYVTASGLRVEIGNSNTAYDSAALLYAPEIGVYDRSFGDSRGAFYAYNTDGYPRASNNLGQDMLLNDYLGIFVSYSVGDFTARASVIDPNQVSSIDGLEKEYSVSANYTWNERLELSAAAAKNGKSIDGNDQYFLGARYKFNDMGRAGLNWIDNGETAGGADLGKTIVIYGDYMVAPMTTINGYIANNDADGNETDNAFGIGAKYDLGGAYLAGSVQRGFNKLYTADMGVRFDF